MTFEEFVRRIGVMLRLEISPPATPATGLYDDLGFDSFQAFELLIAIEALADALVPPVDVPALFTLGDAFAYYVQLRAAELAGRD